MAAPISGASSTSSFPHEEEAYVYLSSEGSDSGSSIDELMHRQLSFSTPGEGGYGYITIYPSDACSEGGAV